MAKKQLDEKLINKGGANGDETIADPVAKNATLPGSKDQGEKTNPLQTAADLKSKTPEEGGSDSADSNKATLNMKPSDASAANVGAKLKQEEYSIDVAFDGEDLSEEFKEKATTIFEAAVNAKVVTIKEELEAEFEKKLEEAASEFTTKLSEQVDEYLTYVAEQWMEANELAIESSLRTEITEEFIGGMKQLFTENYIEIPEDKFDVIEELTAKVEELETKLNESIDNNIQLKSTVKTYAKEAILAQVAEGLTVTQKEKFLTLADGVDYTDDESFEKKLETVKESYFKAKTGEDLIESEVALLEEEEAPAKPETRLSGAVAGYVQAISRTAKK